MDLKTDALKNEKDHFPRRAFSAPGVKQLKTPLFKPSSVYVKFGTSRMPGSRNIGVMNPAYREETIDNSEPVTDIDDGGILSDDRKLNQASLKFDIQNGQTTEKVNGKIDGTSNSVVESSKKNGNPPETEQDVKIARNDDVIINMQRNVDSQKVFIH